MFQLWGKIVINNTTTSDHVFELKNSSLSLEEKINKGLETLCYHFDIQKPMWFSDNSNDFKQIGKTRFMDQHFIETIDFDCLEIELLEHN